MFFKTVMPRICTEFLPLLLLFFLSTISTVDADFGKTSSKGSSHEISPADSPSLSGVVRSRTAHRQRCPEPNHTERIVRFCQFQIVRQ
jgi:hypothetical protein